MVNLVAADNQVNAWPLVEIDTHVLVGAWEVAAHGPIHIVGADLQHTGALDQVTIGCGDCGEET